MNTLQFVAALMAQAVVAIAATPPAWERVASLPVANGGFFSGVVDGNLLVAGGTAWDGDTKLWLDQIWSYNPTDNVWKSAGKLPAPVAYPSSGYNRNALWFAGGSSGTETHRTLWKLSAQASLQKVAAIDHGAVYTASALIGSTLYIVGGTDDQARLDRLTNAFIAIEVTTGATTRLANYPETTLTTATAAAIGSQLFVFGGARWDANTKTVVNHSSAYSYSPDTQRWEPLPPLPLAVRGLTAVALDPNHILIAGGYRSAEIGFVADAFIFNVKTRTYSPTRPLPYAAMVSLVPNGEWLYCLGGEDRMRHRSDAVFRIRWQDLLTAGR
jgi:N-acetylneuraminic acid mutarotase